MTSISATTLSSLSKSTDDSTKKASETYTQFLHLLTTQLQNQDPLDPMESNEFTNQLVQFSQVEQGILTNQKLDSMLTQTSNNQIGQSLAYIGKDVYFKGNAAYYDGSTDMKIGYAIDGVAKSAKVQIQDKDGNTIRTMDIPPGTASGSITWDGKDSNEEVVKAGTYTINIGALDETGTPIPSYTGVPGHVVGIESVDGVLYLALTGDNRIDATSVLSISEPDAPAPDPVGDTGDTGGDTGNDPDTGTTT